MRTEVHEEKIAAFVIAKSTNGFWRASVAEHGVQPVNALDFICVPAVNTDGSLTHWFALPSHARLFDMFEKFIRAHSIFHMGRTVLIVASRVALSKARALAANITPVFQA